VARKSPVVRSANARPKQRFVNTRWKLLRSGAFVHRNAFPD
jgi:hypothetical protein